jgi:15-cis-phytoene synthase
MSILEKYNSYKSYKECIELFKIHSKSYYLGAMFFPFKKFKHVCTFYGLVRVADNIVDTPNLSEEDKKDKLDSFINIFFSIYDLEDKEYDIIKNDNGFWKKYNVIFRSLFSTIKEVNLERHLFERFFKSMKMDLEKYKYETYEDLEEYMDGSAAVIGEIMLKIMMYKDDFYINHESIIRKNYSNILGKSFQLTNFIRDIREDYNMNPSRIYLPMEEIRKYNLDLSIYNRSCNIDERFKEFIVAQISRNRILYNFSDIGVNMLSHNDRLAIKLSRILYSRILDKIEENEYELFLPQKIKVSFREKLYIIYDNIGIIHFIKIIINYILYSYFAIIMFILF